MHVTLFQCVNLLLLDFKTCRSPNTRKSAAHCSVRVNQSGHQCLAPLKKPTSTSWPMTVTGELISNAMPFDRLIMVFDFLIQLERGTDASVLFWDRRLATRTTGDCFYQRGAAQWICGNRGNPHGCHFPRDPNSLPSASYVDVFSVFSSKWNHKNAVDSKPMITGSTLRHYNRVYNCFDFSMTTYFLYFRSLLLLGS